MTVRTSQAQWKGSLKQGQGTMKLGSGAFEGAYSFLALIAGILSSGSAIQSRKDSVEDNAAAAGRSIPYQLNRTQLGTTKSE
jgi:hypothetical protein